jgi:hypothetical protein
MEAKNSVLDSETLLHTSGMATRFYIITPIKFCIIDLVACCFWYNGSLPLKSFSSFLHDAYRFARYWICAELC